jgi:hypothetical protein
MASPQERKQKNKENLLLIALLLVSIVMGYMTFRLPSVRESWEKLANTLEDNEQYLNADDAFLTAEELKMDIEQMQRRLDSVNENLDGMPQSFALEDLDKKRLLGGVMRLASKVKLRISENLPVENVKDYKGQIIVDKFCLGSADPRPLHNLKFSGTFIQISNFIRGLEDLKWEAIPIDFKFEAGDKYLQTVKRGDDIEERLVYMVNAELVLCL